MRRFIISILTLALASFGGLSAQQPTAQEIAGLLEQTLPEGQQWVPGEVIVRMAPGITLSAAGADAVGLDSTSATSGGDVLLRLPQTVLVNLSAQQTADRVRAAVDQLSGLPNVIYAQPNFILQIVGAANASMPRDRVPDDARYVDQWHYRNNGSGAGESPGGINLPRVWETNTGSLGVAISVIDTGILPNHPDIIGSANQVGGFDFISSGTRANDGDGRDNDPTDAGDAVIANECFPGSPARGSSWHGSHVAGTIGVGNTDNTQSAAGVNWAASVQALRVLGRCGGSTADINDAIRWAAGLPVPGVPANPNPADIINMSLGGPQPCSASPSTQSAINDAVAAGVLVVVAAGNDAMDAAGSFPASCNGVVTVAASEARGRLATRYSNFGATVDIMAPGGDVFRDDDGNGDFDGVLSYVAGGEAFYNGTSMAAPHVAGVAALWLAADPTMTAADLRNRMVSTAMPRTSTECPEACGAGLIDAFGDSTPPRRAVTLTINPDKKYKNGETGTATAVVLVNGAPVAGETVTFTSSNISAATVSPATAVTDASGAATTTVTAVRRGNSTITAESGGVSSNNTVFRTPALAWFGGLAMALVLLLLGAYLLRRQEGWSATGR